MRFILPGTVGIIGMKWSPLDEPSSSFDLWKKVWIFLTQTLCKIIHLITDTMTATDTILIDCGFANVIV